eukprot:s792_g23.t1
MGNGCESIISSSPLLGLAALESHLSKRAKTGSTARADAEEEAKKKCTLELSKLKWKRSYRRSAPLKASESECSMGSSIWISALKDSLAARDRGALPHISMGPAQT